MDAGVRELREKFGAQARSVRASGLLGRFGEPLAARKLPCLHHEQSAFRNERLHPRGAQAAQVRGERPRPGDRSQVAGLGRGEDRRELAASVQKFPDGLLAQSDVQRYGVSDRLAVHVGLALALAGRQERRIESRAVRSGRRLQRQDARAGAEAEPEDDPEGGLLEAGALEVPDLQGSGRIRRERERADDLLERIAEIDLDFGAEARVRNGR